MNNCKFMTLTIHPSVRNMEKSQEGEYRLLGFSCVVGQREGFKINARTLL